MSAEAARAVVDTNVLVSSMIRGNSPPGQLVRLVRNGQLRLVVDDRILDEYDDVLHRLELRALFRVADADVAIASLHQGMDRVLCEHVVNGLPDLDDAAFLETALTAGVPLVTGNLKHFPKRKCKGAEVLSPKAFLQKYFA